MKRVYIFLVLTCLLALGASLPASADSACAGSLNTLIADATTCLDTTGNLAFTFNGENGYWSATDFTVSAVADGFTLTFDGGPQTISSFRAQDWAKVTYHVKDLTNWINGESVSGGILKSALAPNGYGAGYAYSQYYGWTTGDAAGDVTNSTAWADVENDNNGGAPGIYNYQDQLGPAYFLGGGGTPFASGNGTAYPFYLDVYQGGGAGWSASWDGTPTTFTYSLTNSGPVTSAAEPNVLALLLVGIVGLGALAWRKRIACMSC